MTPRRWSRILALGFLLGAGSPPLAAQRACGDSGRTDAPADASWASPLDRRITVRIVDVSLRDALDRVAAEARIRLSYSRELLPLDRRVCIDHRSAPAGHVLDQLLAGSGLRAVGLGGDQVVLSRRAASFDRLPASIDSTARVQQLIPVVVTATQTAAIPGRGMTASIVRIDGGDLARGELGTLAQVLEAYAPGAWGWSAGGSAVATRHAGIRGASSFGSSAPKIYIDGIELANSSIATVLASDVIERIEIIRGPQGAALYGSDALNGVVSITTRHEGAVGPGIDLGLRSAGGMVESRYASPPSFTQRHSLTLRAGSFPHSLSLVVTGDESGSYLPGAASRGLAAVVTGRVAGPRASLGVTGRLAGVDAMSPLAVTSLPSAGSTGGVQGALSSESVRQYTLGVSAQLRPSDRWRHSLVAGIDGYRLSVARDDSTEALARTDPLIDEVPVSAARASVRAASVGRVVVTDATSATLTVGAEYTVLHEAAATGAIAGGSPDSRAGDLYQPGGDSRGARGPRQAYRTVATQRLLETSRSGTGLLSQLDLSFHEAVFLTGGLRIERTGVRAESMPVIAVLPMVGAAAVAERGDLTVKLRAAYGKGIRTPRAPPIERVGGGTYAQIRTAMMMPEQQAGFEVGIDLFAGRAFSLQLTRFDQLASGLQQRVATSLGDGDVVYHFRSVGEIANRGWEIQPAVTFGPLSVSGAVSLIDSRVRTVAAQYDGDLHPGDRMLGVPAMTAGLSIGYEARRTSASIGLSHARDWVGYDVLAMGTEGESGPTSLRDYWREYSGATQLRAALSRDLGRGLTLVVTGENLLDQAWGALDNGTAVPGRTTTAGLRVRF